MTGCISVARGCTTRAEKKLWGRDLQGKVVSAPQAEQESNLEDIFAWQRSKLGGGVPQQPETSGMLRLTDLFRREHF